MYKELFEFNIALVVGYYLSHTRPQRVPRPTIEAHNYCVLVIHYIIKHVSKRVY